MGKSHITSCILKGREPAQMASLYIFNNTRIHSCDTYNMHISLYLILIFEISLRQDCPISVLAVFSSYNFRLKASCSYHFLCNDCNMSYTKCLCLIASLCCDLIFTWIQVYLLGKRMTKDIAESNARMNPLISRYLVKHLVIFKKNEEKRTFSSVYRTLLDCSLRTSADSLRFHAS